MLKCHLSLEAKVTVNVVVKVVESLTSVVIRNKKYSATQNVFIVAIVMMNMK